jgi:hypothetical protein
LTFKRQALSGVNPVYWLNHDKLDFKQVVDYKTGLLKDKLAAEYNGLTFTIYNHESNTRPLTTWLTGSIHKYYSFLMGVNGPNQYNDYLKAKGYNGNQFNYSMFIEAIESIENSFCVSFDNSALHHLEYGVNFSTSYETSKVLDGCILHGAKEFNSERSRFKYIQRAEKENYTVKVYDKGLQYGEFDPLVRFEKKVNKMIQIKDFGINNLGALRDLEKWSLLNNDLLKCWDTVLFVDQLININELTNKEKLRLKDYNNAKYWNGINSNHRHRPKGYYKDIETKCGGKMKAEIKESLRTALDGLTECVRINTSCKLSDVTHLPIINTHYREVG